MIVLIILVVGSLVKCAEVVPIELNKIVSHHVFGLMTFVQLPLLALKMFKMIVLVELQII